jgi:hypothetical protein
MSPHLWVALVIAIALFAGLLVPFLVEEIRRGKIELGPQIPTGAGDTHPGYRGNPTPGQPMSVASADRATLSLRSFHLVLIWLSIVLVSGTGVWALLNNEMLLGALSLGAALLLIVYGSYFLTNTENAR